MVENNVDDDATDQLKGMTEDLADTRALQALQAEIEYHRKLDENGTYIQKALGFIPIASNSLRDLEQIYKNEVENPTMSNQEIIDAVKQDQHRLSQQDLVTAWIGNAAKLGFVVAGKKVGLAASLATFALDTMHPNHSLGEQAFEGLAGVGIGFGAARILKYGLKSPDRGLGLLAGAVPYGLSHSVSRNIGGSVPAPDPEAILNLPLLPGEQPERKEDLPMPEWINPYSPPEGQDFLPGVQDFEPVPLMPDLIAPQVPDWGQFSMLGDYNVVE